VTDTATPVRHRTTAENLARLQIQLATMTARCERAEEDADNLAGMMTAFLRGGAIRPVNDFPRALGLHYEMVELRHG
jgi:hypothetical protein